MLTSKDVAVESPSGHVTKALLAVHEQSHTRFSFFTSGALQKPSYLKRRTSSFWNLSYLMFYLFYKSIRRSFNLKETMNIPWRGNERGLCLGGLCTMILIGITAATETAFDSQTSTDMLSS
jgi:hypothetical protein